jgi:hypothetical protein
MLGFTKLVRTEPYEYNQSPAGIGLLSLLEKEVNALLTMVIGF